MISCFFIVDDDIDDIDDIDNYDYDDDNNKLIMIILMMIILIMVVISILMRCTNAYDYLIDENMVHYTSTLNTSIIYY